MKRNNALRQAREAKNWSQGDVARKICVDVRTYRRWEQENTLPRLESIKQLCDLFSLAPDQLGFDLYSQSSDA